MSCSPEVFIEPCKFGETKKKLEDEFNMSQQEKMDVYLRIRPTLPSEILEDHKPCIHVQNDNSVSIKASSDSCKNKSSNDSSGQDQKFIFTQAFGPDTDQIQFFETTMKSTLENFIQGQNGLVFAYGSSGSGKTYTMQGSHAKPGVIPLTIQLLFSSIKGRQILTPFFKPCKYCDVIRLSKQQYESEEAIRDKFLGAIDLEDFDNTKCMSGKLSSVSLSTIFSDDSGWENSCHSDLSEKEMLMLQSSVRMKDIGRTSVNLQEEALFSVWISFLELYNENLYDLLEPISSNRRTKLFLKEDENKNIFVKGLKEIRVCTSEEALKLLHLGKKNLRIASTKLNYESSRSHCILNIKVIRVLDSDNPVAARVNKLSFCDLAGSERISKTQNTGLRLKEASNINNSLLVLGRCIQELRQQENKERKIVPFRDSKLTRLFSGFFIGKGKASMIVNVSPSSIMYSETVAALKFSAIAKHVVSNEVIHQPALSVTHDISRLTEAWGRSNARWSSFSKANVQHKDSCDVDCDTSVEGEDKKDEMFDSFDEVNERDRIIEELLQHVKTLNEKLVSLTCEKNSLEQKIRSEVCREFAEHFVQIEDCYREQINGSEEICDKVMNKKAGFMKKGLNLSSTNDVEDNEMSDGEYEESCSDDEADYVNASDVISEKTITKAEESSLGNSTANHVDDQNMEWVENMKNLITPQDVDPSSLHKQIAELQQDIKRKENRLCSLDDTMKSKDKDILLMKEKMEEMLKEASAKDSKLKEFQDCLNLKDQQIKELEEKFDQQSRAMALGESIMKELKDEVCSKGSKIQELNNKIDEINEIMLLKESLSISLEHATNPKDLDEQAKTVALEENLKKLEDAVNSKDTEILSLQKKIDEFENVLREKEDARDLKVTIDSKETIICSLKEEIGGLMNDVKSKENEVKELANIICCKDTEIDTLTRKVDEQAKANISKISSVDNDVEAQNSVINELERKMKQNLEVISLKDKTLEDCKALIFVKETEIAALKREKETEEKSLENYRTQIINLDAEIEKLIKEKEAEVLTLSNYKTQLLDKDSEVMELKKKKETVEKAMANYETQLHDKDIEIELLKKEKETEMKKSQLENDHVQVIKDAELTTLTENIDTQFILLKAKEEKIQEYKDILTSKENEISALKATIEDQIKAITIKDEKIQECEGLVLERENEIRSLKAAITNKTENTFHETVDDSVASNSSRDCNLEALMRKLKEQMELKPLNYEGPGNEMVIESFNVLTSHTAKINELTKECEGLKKKFAEDNKLIEEKEMMLEEARKMIITKDEDIEKLKKNIVMLENKLELEANLNSSLEMEKDREKESKLVLTLQKLVYRTDEKLEQAKDDLLKASSNIVEKDKIIEELQKSNSQFLLELKQSEENLTKHVIDDIKKDNLIAELQESNNQIISKLTKAQEKAVQNDIESQSLDAVHCLQRIEYISADNTVSLQHGNRKLSVQIDLLKESVIELENQLEEKTLTCISQKHEIEALKGSVSKRKSGVRQSISKIEYTGKFVDVLQQIEYISTENTKKLLSYHNKIDHEKSILNKELKTVKSDLDMASQEIDVRETEHIRIASDLKKKEAMILILEKDLSKATEKADYLEAKYNTLMYEGKQQQQQHHVQTEKVKALKQVEAEFRKSEGKKKDNQKREKRGRPRRQHLLEESEVAPNEAYIEPLPKRKATQNKVYNEDEENTSPSSISVITLDDERLIPAASAPTSIQRLQEYVVEKSKNAAQCLASVFSPKTAENEDSNAPVSNRRKRKLFNNSCAPQLITSPIREIMTPISPKKVVAKKLRKKKVAK